MARRIREVCYDDMDGKEVAELITETFTVRGVAYQIDLGPDSARRYAEALEPFRACAQADRTATRTTGTGVRLRSVRPERSKPTVPARVDREQNRAIRDWWARYAEAAGLPQPGTARGRIPEAVCTAFHEHGGLPVPASRSRRRSARRPSVATG